jgi:sec-independent protein translocase protein TatA
MFSGADAPWHWLILIILVVALFGYKKLPDAARSLGRSMRIFKTEIKGMTEDDAAREARANAPAAPAVAVTETKVTETNLVKQTPVADVVVTGDAPAAVPAPAPVASSVVPSVPVPSANGSSSAPSASGAQATTPGTV